MSEITVKELLEKDKKNIQIIDIRESYEYEAGHIDSINIPMSKILNSCDIISKEKQVIIYCQSGRRGASVVYMLQRKFKLNNVFNLKGGYSDYIEKI